MTVYVDKLPDAGWGRWNGGAHMMGSDLAELHAMARQIGLKREWFQDDSTFAHYDLTASKRRLAVQAGAVEIEENVIPDDVLMLDRITGRYEQRAERMTRMRAGGSCDDQESVLVTESLQSAVRRLLDVDGKGPGRVRVLGVWVERDEGEWLDWHVVVTYGSKDQVVAVCAYRRDAEAVGRSLAGALGPDFNFDMGGVDG